METSKLMRLFGQRLAQLRSSRSMTQEELAEATGLSVDFLSLMERGLRSPSFSTLEKLARAIGVEVKDLFDFEGGLTVIVPGKDCGK